ncbi:hypothetical protein GCM10009605_36730 [Nocardiopsis composta]
MSAAALRRAQGAALSPSPSGMRTAARFDRRGGRPARNPAAPQDRAAARPSPASAAAPREAGALRPAASRPVEKAGGGPRSNALDGGRAPGGLSGTAPALSQPAPPHPVSAAAGIGSCRPAVQRRSGGRGSP